MIKTAKFLAGASLAILSLAAGSAGAQPPRTEVLGGPQPMRVASVERRTVSIPRGKSASLDFSREMRISGSTDVKVADIRMVTPNHATILGVNYGQTDAQFYDAQGRLALVLDIRVEQDIRALDESLARIIPTARIQAQAVNDSIILTGTVANAGEADRAVQVASVYAGKIEMVRNLLTIVGKDQVTLRVQAVEVSRSVLKQLGFDTNFIMGQLGMPQTVIGNTPSYAVNGGFQGGAGLGYQLDTTKQPIVDVLRPITAGGVTTVETVQEVQPGNLLSTPRDSIGKAGTNQARAMIQAFERQGLVRTLAEPTLTAVSGEAARFLAGGEFPVPTGRDAQGNVTIEFKPFGVGLGFTPMVLSDGRISLKLSTEVSELSTQGALTLVGLGGDDSSMVIPALSVRRVENTIELPSGGSMMVAGLLQEQTRQNIDKIPGIGDMPVLGTLARSRDYLNNQTELVIIVTAYLTSSTSRDSLQTPADGLHIASDAETILRGKLNTAYKASPEVQARKYEGPFGHVID